MKFITTSGALLALLATTAFVPARAADTSANDFHCMVIGTIMAEAANDEIKNAGLFMTLYYLGRVDGSGKDVDFLGGYKDELAKFPQLDMETEAKNCSTLLTARGAALSKLAPPPDAPPPATPGPATPAPEKPVP